VSCPNCGGTGFYRAEIEGYRCPRCGGSGELVTGSAPSTEPVTHQTEEVRTPVVSEGTAVLPDSNGNPVRLHIDWQGDIYLTIGDWSRDGANTARFCGPGGDGAYALGTKRALRQLFAAMLEDAACKGRPALSFEDQSGDPASQLPVQTEQPEVRTPVIENGAPKALKWTGDNIEEVFAFMSPTEPVHVNQLSPISFLNADSLIGMWTERGLEVAEIGDWLVRDGPGRFHPSKSAPEDQSDAQAEQLPVQPNASPSTVREQADVLDENRILRSALDEILGNLEAWHEQTRNGELATTLWAYIEMARAALSTTGSDSEVRP